MSTKMRNILYFHVLFFFIFYSLLSVECARNKKPTKLVGNAQVKSLLLKSKNCTQRQFDKLDFKLNNILPFGPKPRPLPNSEEQLKPWCRDGMELVFDFEKFIRQCFTTDARDMSLIANYSIKQMMRRYCYKKKSKATKELLSMADCLNKQVIPNQNCVDMVLNSTMSIIEIKETKGGKMKIPQICCLYHTTSRCMENVIERFPCLNQRRDFISEFIGSSMENVLDVVCGDYAYDSSKCDSLPKLKKPDLSLHSSSYIMLMVEMLNSMESVL